MKLILRSVGVLLVAATVATCGPDPGANNNQLPQDAVASICGDGELDPGEVCDDGNVQGGDGCSVDCQSNETCGNGYLDTAAGEVCDDGNWEIGDGCNQHCERELLTIATEQGSIYSMAVNSTHLFWASTGTNPAVKRVSVEGGAPSQIAGAGVGAGPVYICLDSTHVYYVNSPDGEIGRAPLSGPGGTVLNNSLNSPSGIAVDSTYVYWTASGATPHTVERMLKDGSGSPIVLASEQHTPRGVAVDSTHVYWANFYGDSVMKAPLEGGETELFDSISMRPQHVILSATHLYYATSWEGGRVGRIPLDGGSGETLSSGQNRIQGIAIDGTHVYWTANFDETIMRVPLDGGEPEALAAEIPFPYAIAVDDTYVYWSDGDRGGRVMKMLK